MRFAWMILFAACGGDAPPPQVPVQHVDAAAKVKRVHGIISLSMGCWASRDDLKCKDLIVLADGKENPAEMDSARELDEGFAREMQEKIDTFAHADAMPDADAKAAVKLYNAIVDASRESLAARKAIESLKADPDSEKVATGDTKIATALKPTFALEALLKLDTPPYTKDAELAALAIALDRVKTAGALPKPLRLFAVAGPYKVVFGVEPSIKLDEPRPIRDGTWIAYIVQTAQAAGHPVASSVTDPKEQVRAAWEGIQAGFADRMKAARSEALALK